MTPTEIIEACRNQYNAINDDFFGESEMLKLIYLGEQELVHEGLIIESTYQTTTVADQQEYPFPTNMVAIKRVEYDGTKLQPINFRQDDSITLYNSATTNTGEPQFYMEWNDTIILRPIPSDAQTLKIRGYKEPDTLTINSSLEIPAFFHGAIICYVTMMMASKDQNWSHYDRSSARFDGFWKPKIRQWVAKRKGKDACHIVNNEDILGVSLMGTI